VAKAAQVMGLKVCKPSSPEAAELAKKLPLGQLYATGRAFVPHVRQSLYSDMIVALAAEPQQAAVGPDDETASTPVARGLPRSWDEIAPGHLVIAQESLANGWWEAIVLDRNDDMLTLRFRDYRLSAAPEVLSPSDRGRADEPGRRSVRLCGFASGSGRECCPGPCPPNPTPCPPPVPQTEVRSWTQRLRAFAR
jgi:hypothetical protein